jgi:hypothetical protein
VYRSGCSAGSGCGNAGRNGGGGVARPWQRCPGGQPARWRYSPGGVVVVDAGEPLGAEVGCVLRLGGREVLLGERGQVRLRAGDDQHLFDAVEIDRRVHHDGGVGLVVGVGRDALDGADGQPARIDLVAAGGEHGLAGLDARVGGEIADLHRPVTVPRRIARMRVLARMTPAPEVWSLISSTCAVVGKTSRSLPTMPSWVMTAMSGLSPSREPLSMVSTRDCSLPLAPMTCAATVDATYARGSRAAPAGAALERVLGDRGLLDAHARELLLQVWFCWRTWRRSM